MSMSVLEANLEDCKACLQAGGGVLPLAALRLTEACRPGSKRKMVATHVREASSGIRPLGLESGFQSPERLLKKACKTVPGHPLPALSECFLRTKERGRASESAKETSFCAGRIKGKKGTWSLLGKAEGGAQL